MGFLVVAFLLERGARLVQVIANHENLRLTLILGVSPMEVESPKKQLELMEILVDGCKKHPAYREFYLQLETVSLA